MPYSFLFRDISENGEVKSLVPRMSVREERQHCLPINIYAGKKGQPFVNQTYNPTETSLDPGNSSKSLARG